MMQPKHRKILSAIITIALLFFNLIGAPKASAHSEDAEVIPAFAFENTTPGRHSFLAFIGYSLCLIFSLALINRIRTAHLKKRNEELELLVRQRTKELEEQNLALTKANSVKENFLASISHDIRNPLNGILGIAQLLKDDPTTSQVEVERVNHLYSCANYLRRLMGQMLDFTSLESGTLQTKPISFDITKLLKIAINEYQYFAERKGLRLQIHLPPQTHHWIGDPILIKQILITLLSNAIEHTQNGYVSVALETCVEESSAWAIFTVEDSGTGITPSKQDSIFEGFTQLTELAEGDVAGTGLGLAVARRTAELMEGTLTLDSSHQAGARFILQLPYKLGKQINTNKVPPSIDNARLLENKTVLIADDMDFNRYINNELLTKLGAHVEEAENGEEALNRLLEKDYSLAVLDINMPQKNGIEVVSEYLKQRANTQTIIIALSGYVTAEMEELCLKKGFHHFIEKPLDQAKLSSILDNTEPKSNTSEQTEPASLLNYLANNDPKATEALKRRYQAAFLKELGQLRTAIENDSDKLTRASIHKLTGLSNLRREEIVAEWLANLSEIRYCNGGREALDICQKIEAHIKAL